MFDFLYAYERYCSKHVMSICVIVYNIYFVKDMKSIFIFIVCIWESTELVKNFVICWKIFSWLLNSLLHACFQNCSYKISFRICEQFKWMGKENIYFCLISCEEKVLLLFFSKLASSFCIFFFHSLFFKLAKSVRA